MKFQIPKGVFDILPTDPSSDGFWRSSHIWQYLEEQIHQLAKAYGYQQIRTPIFERTELFVRSVGETSDIVTKEMYTFADRADRSMTLRPEGTAPVMRACIEKRLDQIPGSSKLYYIGPMFRYERPQAGRYRQHHQFGVEAIGDRSPEQDIETIDMLVELFRRLGLKGLDVKLNSIGDQKSREHYCEQLRAFLTPLKEKLSPDSQLRLDKNILRILDSKDLKDQAVLKEAPSILDSLSDEAKDHFDKVCEGLKRLNIAYTLTPNLVRGLDYYSNTVFEVTSTALGAQNSVGGGGRYDGLYGLLGGPDLPAVGFATGLERVIQTMLAQNVPLPEKPHPAIVLIPMGDAAKSYAMQLTSSLRHTGIPTQLDWKAKKVGKALENAGKLGATFALVIGDEEIASGKGKIKELSTREETTLPFNELADFLLGRENKLP